MQCIAKTTLLLPLLLAFILSYSQSTIEFECYFNNKVWHADSTYENSAKELIQINRLMFYTTQWKAIHLNLDTISLSGEHFLVNVQDSASLKLPFRIPANSQKLMFRVGVDSIKNTSGIQTGVLDPALGMFWTWRTGYIMAKMHGVSPVAKTAGNRFSYEVGGFQQPYDAVRTIVLDLPTQQQKKQPITIEVHIDKWFNGKKMIQIGETPNCHTAGPLAMQLADNYATMFRIKQIQTTQQH